MLGICECSCVVQLHQGGAFTFCLPFPVLFVGLGPVACTPSMSSVASVDSAGGTTFSISMLVSSSVPPCLSKSSSYSSSDSESSPSFPVVVVVDVAATAPSALSRLSTVLLLAVGLRAFTAELAFALGADCCCCCCCCCCC